MEVPYALADVSDVVDRVLSGWVVRTIQSS